VQNSTIGISGPTPLVVLKSILFTGGGTASVGGV